MPDPTYRSANRFFLTREQDNGIYGPERIHLRTHIPRTLTFEDARELALDLLNLVGSGTDAEIHHLPTVVVPEPGKPGMPVPLPANVGPVVMVDAVVVPSVEGLTLDAPNTETVAQLHAPVVVDEPVTVNEHVPQEEEILNTVE